MRNSTRIKFNAFCAAMAATYGIESVDKTFAATPSIEQRLVDKVIDTNELLQRVNVVTVPELKGEKVFGSVSKIIGKRTDVSVGDRLTSNPLNLDSRGYECKFTEYDVNLPYVTMDMWAKFPDLADRFLRYVREQIAMSMIEIGFHGEDDAQVETDPGTYPNGQDVNKGWIQKLRDFDGGAQILDEGGTVGEIRLGGAGDFVNLDDMVHQVLQMIHPAHRGAADLVAIMGRDLMTFDKGQLYIAQGQTPTEKERVENNQITRTYGGLPSYSFGNVPARALIITSFNNLSIYRQEESTRQHIMDNPKRNRIEYYNSVNDAYVVEDEQKAASVEFDNVRIWDGAAFS